MLRATGVQMISDEQIYFAFPRHIAKHAALRAIAKAVKELAKTMGEEMARSTLLRATEMYALSPQGRRPDRQFIPHPATWFNQGRYLDDPYEWELGRTPFEPGIFHGEVDTRELTEAEIHRINNTFRRIQ